MDAIKHFPYTFTASGLDIVKVCDETRTRVTVDTVKSFGQAIQGATKMNVATTMMNNCAADIDNIGSDHEGHMLGLDTSSMLREK